MYRPTNTAEVPSVVDTHDLILRANITLGTSHRWGALNNVFVNGHITLRVATRGNEVVVEMLPAYIDYNKLMLDDLEVVVSSFTVPNVVAGSQREEINKRLLRNIVEEALSRPIIHDRTAWSFTDEAPLLCPNDIKTGLPLKTCPMFHLQKRSKLWWRVSKMLDKLFGPEGSDARKGAINNMSRNFCLKYGAKNSLCRCILRNEDPEYKAIIKKAPSTGAVNNRCWFEPCWNADSALPDHTLEPCNSNVCSITYNTEDVGGSVHISGDVSIKGCGSTIDTNGMITATGAPIVKPVKKEAHAGSAVKKKPATGVTKKKDELKSPVDAHTVESEGVASWWNSTGTATKALIIGGGSAAVLAVAAMALHHRNRSSRAKYKMGRMNRSDSWQWYSDFFNKPAKERGLSNRMTRLRRRRFTKRPRNTPVKPARALADIPMEERGSRPVYTTSMPDLQREMEV
jgi:hypothetical protein